MICFDMMQWNICLYIIIQPNLDQFLRFSEILCGKYLTQLAGTTASITINQQPHFLDDIPMFCLLLHVKPHAFEDEIPWIADHYIVTLYSYPWGYEKPCQRNTHPHTRAENHYWSDQLEVESRPLKKKHVFAKCRSSRHKPNGSPHSSWKRWKTHPVIVKVSV